MVLTMVTKQWSDLPLEILSLIADRLCLIDLLRFRLVCKDFLSASSTARAEIETIPWFLVYGQNSTPKCSLLDFNNRKTYNLNIPQLRGAICLASSEGWLLMFRKGSMFFFSPFSNNVKIDLPKFPHSKLITYHVGAFSSPPTEKDCIVFVITRTNCYYDDISLLQCGRDSWGAYRFSYGYSLLYQLRAAVYFGGAFYSFDQSGAAYASVMRPDLVHTFWWCVPFGHTPFYVEAMGLKELLGLKDDVSISTCGTMVKPDEGHSDSLMDNEYCKSSSPYVKGVWILPRFFHSSTITIQRW